MTTNLKLIAAVAAVATHTKYKSSRLKKKNHNLAQHNTVLIDLNEMTLGQLDAVIVQLKGLSEMNDFLLIQNNYMVELLDRHNVPVTEFDKIALNYHGPKK